MNMHQKYYIPILSIHKIFSSSGQSRHKIKKQAKKNCCHTLKGITAVKKQRRKKNAGYLR